MKREREIKEKRLTETQGIGEKEIKWRLARLGRSESFFVKMFIFTFFLTTRPFPGKSRGRRVDRYEKVATAVSRKTNFDKSSRTVSEDALLLDHQRCQEVSVASGQRFRSRIFLQRLRNFRIRKTEVVVPDVPQFGRQALDVDVDERVVNVGAGVGRSRRPPPSRSEAPEEEDTE